MVVRKKRTKTGPPASKNELTEVEWAIIKVIWEKQPCTAGMVQEALADTRGWAYSTVKTTMDRMEKKGFLEITKMRNLKLFQARINKTQAIKGEFRRMLTRAFDGSLTPLMEYVIDNEDLSQQDLKQLRQMVAKAQVKKR